LFGVFNLSTKMKTTKIQLFALTLLIALALTSSWGPRVQAQKPTPATTWQYKVVAVDAQATDESRLNGLGGDGWELVAVTGGEYRGFYFFKRAK
jgi:hypothetical protein